MQVKALRKNEGNLHLNSAFGAILLTLRGRKVCRGMLDFGKVPTQQVLPMEKETMEMIPKTIEIE
ncbi:MAG: hypothetical protein IJ468_15055 [Lachnospiraceae bacterium]|nr:hypothetical protein [Lachnospiraceae bacterium]